MIYILAVNHGILFCAVPFRNRERILFDHLVSMKKPGETALLHVLRDGKEHQINVSLQPVSLLPISVAVLCVCICTLYVLKWLF